jgi:subtilisin family serine protease
MKQIFGKMVLLLALVVMLASPVVASEGVGPVEPLAPAASSDSDAMVNETPTLWFVELSSKPVVEGGNLRSINAEKATFRSNAKSAGLTFKERYAFNTLWNGISVEVTPSELAKLPRIAGVKAIYPIDTIQLPPVEQGVNPDLFTALAMTGADVAQSELGYTGAGVKVAVMDTGIDVDHPDFGGDGVADGGPFPSARIQFGYDFVGDDFNADPTSASYNPIPAPDNNPDDCNGHGTHVAGIVGANGAVKGVAPEVTFGAYRVFGCQGSTTADIMLLAMEAALADGMHVLNMSIGSAFQWPQYPTAVAASRLVNKGMVVVASIGNSGTSGLYAAGAPGLGEKVIGVASFDNSHTLLPYFTVNNQNIGYLTMSFSPEPPTSGSQEIVNIGQACNADTLLADPSGKVALASRGVCSFAEKALRAINAGAVAVVISNNVSGVVSGTLGAPLGSDVPVVGISLADGNFIRGQAAPVMLEWTDQSESFLSPTGGLISSFSSYGISPDLQVKPDIGAPGGNIYSTYPLELGGYAVISGTSMSSPHVAGAAALFLQARPDTPAQVVRSFLQNSADPRPWQGNPGLGYLDMVARQGAGMLDIDDAILATTRIEPSKLSVGESQAGPRTFNLRVINTASSPVTYDLSFVNTLSTANTFAPGAFLSNAVVTFSASSLTVRPGSSARVDVTINPPSAPNQGQYGGYVVFTPQVGGQVYRVPFAGFIGDYQSIQVLKPTANGFPWIAVPYQGSYLGPVTGPDDWAFSMQDGDVPTLLVHLDHHSRLFRVEVFDTVKTKPLGRIYDEEYLPRNSTAGGFFAFPFDGQISMGNQVVTLPDGVYMLKLSVLKALGDSANPAHWETWTSPAFTIDRP